MPSSRRTADTTVKLTPYLTRPATALAVVAPKRHLFFLSHMRAYSSLLGHIMGSHPEICGYYEMHIGYHSWKSLVRQKLLYFQDEALKPELQLMFDKVLHSDHYVAPELLDRGNVHALFALRNPEQAIPSILELYAKEDAGHAFNDAAYATRYYIERAETLAQTATAMRNDYVYIDAESITQRTDDCLGLLSDWLNLRTPLDSNYEVQKKTAQGRYGDTSDRLRSGGIHAAKAETERPHVSADLLRDATNAYTRYRDILVSGSSAQCLLPAPEPAHS